jgi:sialate O-acetylesterase
MYQKAGFFLLVSLFLASESRAELRLTRLFGDGMVVQRDVEVPVWGWADPGAEVAVTFRGTTYAARADAAGAWTVRLAPTPAGGPHEIAVVAGDERVRVTDVLAGDVWICSGQSNMEWVVADSNDAEAEVAAADDAEIRHFKVPRGWAPEPETVLVGGEWEVADSAHVGAFTAVGYFFARELRRHVDVPIGLVNASWGGSRIEPWMSAAALGLDRAALAEIRERERDYERQVLERVRARIGRLPERDEGLADGRALWADPELDDAGWDALAVPGRWEEAGFEGMDGVAWYRTELELDAVEARAGVRLGLGAVDDSDTSWVNGYEIGRMERSWNVAREYEVPAAALRAGTNVIAVRVEDTGGGGGIHGDPELLFVESVRGRRPLAGTWKFKVGLATVSVDGHKNQVPTLVYNKMIHPLMRYPIKGVLWYQGESNADSRDDAFAYRGLFPRLIEDWRRGWSAGDFPFLFVQLAGFMAPAAEPADSNWALLRESQSAALALARTAQAVAVDVGDAADVHPRNKQEVGRRLALAARRVAHGEVVVHSGPVYRSHEVRAGRVVIALDHAGGGLAARGEAGVLRGFAVAGEDRRFVWAEAAIDGGRVVVWSDAVPDPVAVRYAWGDNPEDANLSNREGLPASPFRTDAW